MTETYINQYTVATAGSGINNSATSLTVSSAASVDSGFRILVESELMYVSSGGTTTTWTVTRGVEGSTAASHAAGITIYVVLTQAGLGNILTQSSSYPLLEEHTASTSSALNFTSWYSSTYNVYEVVMVNLYCSGAIPTLQFSTNGGSSYDTGSNYMWTQWLFGIGNIQYHSNSDTVINLADFSDISPGADAGLCGTYRLTLPSGGYTNIYGQCFCGRTADGGPPYPPINSHVAGKYINATNPNAFRFVFAGTTITAGSIRVYGVAH